MNYYDWKNVKKVHVHHFCSLLLWYIIFRQWQKERGTGRGTRPYKRNVDIDNHVLASIFVVTNGNISSLTASRAFENFFARLLVMTYQDDFFVDTNINVFLTLATTINVDWNFVTNNRLLASTLKSRRDKWLLAVTQMMIVLVVYFFGVFRIKKVFMLAFGKLY